MTEREALAHERAARMQMEAAALCLAPEGQAQHRRNAEHFRQMAAYEREGEPDISPRSCAAGRKLLGWSQADLAAAAILAISTVADYERGARVPTRRNRTAMKDAIEAKGLVVTAGGASRKPTPLSFNKGQTDE